MCGCNVHQWFAFAARRAELGVSSFGISVTTMEEVFIKVGEGSDEHMYVCVCVCVCVCACVRCVRAFCVMFLVVYGMCTQLNAHVSVLQEREDRQYRPVHRARSLSISQVNEITASRRYVCRQSAQNCLHSIPAFEVTACMSSQSCLRVITETVETTDNVQTEDLQASGEPEAVEVKSKPRSPKRSVDEDPEKGRLTEYTTPTYGRPHCRSLYS